MSVKRLAIVVGVLALNVAPALAQRPNGPGNTPPPQVPPGVVLLRHCLTELNRAVAVATDAIFHTTGRCVHGIEAALADGDDAAAADRAEACTTHVNDIAARATTRIGDIVDRCIAALTEHNATDEVIGRVQDAGDARTARIEQLRAGAVGRIADALAGDGG